MSQLPPALQAHLEALLTQVSRSSLTAARASLTDSYRTPHKGAKTQPHITTDQQRFSYLATRLPATYAVCHDVLSRLASYDLPLTSCLDLGAGPGTATMAARKTLPLLQQCTLMDQDHSFKTFAEGYFQTDVKAAQQIHYEHGDITEQQSYQPHDLVMISYALNELSTAQARHVIATAWQAARHALVIIEPGTPKAFTALKQRRQELIDQGAMILAPCPHDRACPLADEDWCHFSVRINRSAQHKALKQASLPYEDEKFSYLIAIKNHVLDRPDNRIIKNPHRPKGHQIFDLCTSNGLQQRTITKTDKSLYKDAKKSTWGDCLKDNSEG